MYIITNYQKLITKMIPIRLLFDFVMFAEDTKFLLPKKAVIAFPGFLRGISVKADSPANMNATVSYL